MATELFNANLASTNVLAGGTDAPPSGTVETWTVGSSAAFPAAATGTSQFHVADPALNTEVIAVTNVNGNTWTVTRGAENTTPLAHAAGFNVYQVVTTGFLSSLSSTLTNSLTVNPSGDASGVADAANIAAAVASLPSTGGQITLAPTATWYINCGGVVIARSGIYVNAPGARINAVGTGDAIRMYDNTNSWPVYGGGILGFPVIDGTTTGAGSCGVHMGDLLQGACEVFVQNFGASGSIGVHLDNAHYWTEQLYGRIYAQGCASGVVFDVTGATTSTASFARMDVQIYISQYNPTFDGVVIQNGAYLYDGAFILRGNYSGSNASSLSSAALRITGTVPAGHPAAGQGSGIVASRVEIGVEVGSYTYAPTTIIFGSSSNNIYNCYGIMDFSDGGGSFTASSSAARISPFSGTVLGDATLATGVGFGGTQKFTGNVTMTGTVVMEASGGTDELVVSIDGTNNSAGAFVVQTGASGFAAIYDTGNSLYYGIARALPAPSGTSVVGGYYKGLGVGGSSNNTGTPIFGVLTSTQGGEGIGNVALTVLDTNKIFTFNSTLDDANGNMILGGNLYPQSLTDFASGGRLLPSCKAATMPPALVTTSAAALSSSVLTLTSIMLPKGLVVSNMLMTCGGTGENGRSHGWYTLLDSSMIVRAVTADQTAGTTVWGSFYGTGLAFTSPYTVPSAGRYMVGVSITAGTAPIFVGQAGGAISSPLGSYGFSPAWFGTSSTVSTAPSVGSTMATIGNVGTSCNFYVELS